MQQQTVRMAGEWDKNLHPRGPDGKFIGTGGPSRFAPEGHYTVLHAEPSEFKDHAAVRSFLEQHFPHIRWSNLESMDFQIARHLPNHFLNLGAEYPEPMALLHMVNVIPMDGEVIGQVTMGGRIMDLNVRMYGDARDLLSDIQESAKRDWIASDRDPLLSSITHEFGHVIHSWMMQHDHEAVLPMVSADARREGTIASLWTMWRSSHKRGAGIAPAALSRYAMTSPEEGFAEAFRALQHGSEARRHLPYVQQVRALLQHVFGYQAPRYAVQPVNAQNTQALADALAHMKREIGAK